MRRLTMVLLLLAACSKQDKAKPPGPAATPVEEVATPTDAAAPTADAALSPEPDGGGKQLDLPDDATRARFSSFLSKTYPGGTFTDAAGGAHDCQRTSSFDAKGGFFIVKASFVHGDIGETVEVRMRPFGDTFKCESVVTAQHGCARLSQECRGK